MLSKNKRKVRNLLLQGSWYPGRHVDISEFEADLERRGFEMFESARAFLHEFGGLRIDYTVELPLSGANSIRATFPLVFPDYGEYTYSDLENNSVVEAIGMPVCPVGVVMDDSTPYLLITPDNKMYKYTGHIWLALIGDSPMKGIEFVTCGGGEFKQLLPYNDDDAKLILAQVKTVAIVGRPDKTKRYPRLLETLRFLEKAGYGVYLVNLGVEKIDNGPCYQSLTDLPEKIDIVYYMGRDQEQRDAVQDAYKIGAKSFWTPFSNSGAKSEATNNGLIYINGYITSIYERVMKPS